MPTRLLIPLHGPPPESQFQHATGLRALVLRWIEAADPALSLALHEENQPKPYAISPLWNQNGVLSFEISLLADWLLKPLVTGMSECGDEVRLGSQRFRVEQPEIALEASWEELLEPPQPGERRFDLRFLTPTAHHAPGPFRKSVVLPSPEFYFGTWFNRWNLCCEQKMSEGILTTVQERVAVGACTGGTHAVRIDRSRTFIGFQGTVRFQILKPDTLSAEEYQCLQALARFATFCGTGVETMRGMGQTVWVG